MEKEWTYCLSNGVKVIDMLVQKIDMQLEILYIMVCGISEVLFQE